MRFVNKLGLVCVAISLLALLMAAAASATRLYSGPDTLGVGAEIRTSLEGSTSITTTDGSALVTCTRSQVEMTVNNAGGTGKPVTGSGAIWFEMCGSTLVTTVELGTFEINYISGSLNGTVKASGFKLVLHTPLLGSCGYTTGSAIHLGTLTGKTNNWATLDVNAVLTRYSGLCSSTARWMGGYTVTSPFPLHVGDG